MAREEWGTHPWAFRQPQFLVAMLRWTNEQQAFAIKVFYKNSDSVVVVGAQHAFQLEFQLLPHDHFPLANAINLWVRNF